MKARDWQLFFEKQRRNHEKVLFTVSELGNVSGSSRNTLNVELSRLMAQGIVVRYAHGVYGPPAAVSPEILIAYLDRRAYITGAHALGQHNLITEAPAIITCFTDRNSPRGRKRETAIGRFVFVCVRGRVYKLPEKGCLAGPEQALCDFVYMARRQGIRAMSQVTFRRLDSLDAHALEKAGKRYPATVRAEVSSLLRGE
ncbi:MAG: hypothetical protein HQ559_05430 [Lentisphaerae bacterium]|nr:hypothetical protein [Lentisphaerota bacterium]